MAGIGDGRNWLKPTQIEVVTTPTGSCFHEHYCQFVNPRRAKRTNLEEAFRSGYGPCPRCTSDALYLYVDELEASSSTNDLEKLIQNLHVLIELGTRAEKIMEDAYVTREEVSELTLWLAGKSKEIWNNAHFGAFCNSWVGIDKELISNPDVQNELHTLFQALISNLPVLRKDLLELEKLAEHDSSTPDEKIAFEQEYKLLLEYSNILIPALEDGEFSRDDVLLIRSWLASNADGCKAIPMLRAEFMNWRDALEDGKLEKWEIEVLIDSARRTIHFANEIRKIIAEW